VTYTSIIYIQIFNRKATSTGTSQYIAVPTITRYVSFYQQQQLAVQLQQW